MRLTKIFILISMISHLVIGMNEDNPAIIDGWFKSGDFNKEFNSGGSLNRWVEFKNIREGNIIKSIGLFGYKNGSYRIRINVMNTIYSIYDKVREYSRFENGTSLNYFDCYNKDFFVDFITAFYEKDLIPNWVIDEITITLGIDNILLNEKVLLDSIFNQLGELYSEQDLKDELSTKLKEIQNPIRRQKMAWALFLELKERNIIKTDVFLVLLDEITNDNLSFYKEAMRKKAQMLFVKKGTINIYDRCFGSIPYALLSENEPITDLLIRNFLNIDKLPDIIKNLTSSKESVLRCLIYIKELIGEDKNKTK